MPILSKHLNFLGFVSDNDEESRDKHLEAFGLDCKAYLQVPLQQKGIRIRFEYRSRTIHGVGGHTNHSYFVAESAKE